MQNCIIRRPSSNHTALHISPPTINNLACADTGSSHILLRESDAHTLSNIRSSDSIRVSLPNGEIITSSKSGDLSLPHLDATLTAHIFPNDKLGTSLISISELCNNGCVATFTTDNAHVTKDGNTVLHSAKHSTDSLWHVHLPAGNAATAGSAILRSDTDKSFATFIHTSFGSPVLSTFLQAIRKGFLASYPRLTPAMDTTYLSLTAATARGHIDQHRQGLDSTASSEDEEAGSCPTDPPQPTRTAYTKIIPVSHTAHSDLTGRFIILGARARLQ